MASVRRVLANREDIEACLCNKGNSKDVRYCWRDDERCVGSAERRDVRTGLGGSAGAATEPTEEVITVSLGGICRETVGLGGNDGLCVWVCDCDCDCLDNSRSKFTSLLSLGGIPSLVISFAYFSCQVSNICK